VIARASVPGRLLVTVAATVFGQWGVGTGEDAHSPRTAHGTTSRRHCRILTSHTERRRLSVYTDDAYLPYCTCDFCLLTGHVYILIC